MLPRNESVCLWMGNSPKSHSVLNAGCSPSRLKCVSVMNDPVLCTKGLPALVQLFPTWPIHQTAGMVMVKDRHHSPMLHLHGKCYIRKPPFGVETACIILIGAIKGAVYLLTLMLQPYSTQ